MWLAYVDESGNTGRRLDDPDQPIHWLVAVLVPEECVLALTHQMEAIISRRRSDGLFPELHGAELFSGDGPWRGVSPTERAGIYDEALALLPVHDCVVAHASIDKTRLAAGTTQRTTPHLLALQFLVEKIDAYLVRQNDPLRQRALLVADETQEHESFAIGVVAGMQASGTGVVAGRVIDRIIDTVHFVRSRDNRGVQLADLVAYALNRVNRVNWQPRKPGDEALANMLRNRVLPLVRTYRSTWPMGQNESPPRLGVGSPTDAPR